MFRLVLLLCAIVSVSCQESPEDNFGGESFDWNEFVSGFIGMDVVEGLSQIIENLYDKWRDSVSNEGSDIGDKITYAVEIFKMMAGLNQTDYMTGVQNWFLDNLASSISFLKSVLPKAKILGRIETALREPLEAKYTFPEGIVKAFINLVWSVRSTIKPLYMLLEIMLDAKRNEKLYNTPRSLGAAAFPLKTIKTIKKVLLPVKIAGDVLYYTKVKIYQWIKYFWFTTRVIKDLAVSKTWSFYSDLKNFTLSKASVIIEVLSYVKHLIFSPMRFLVTKLLDDEQTPRCMSHNFCMYGMLYLRPLKPRPVMALINRIIPLQRFPVIFMEDLLRKAAKYMSNPDLAAAMMYGKENGNCNKYPAVYCA